MPGFANTTVSRLGWGRGFWGGGRGGVRFSYVHPVSAQNVDALQAQADWLKGQLDAINKRIEEIKPK